MQRGGTKLPTFATATQLIVAGVGVAAKFSRYAGVCGCSNARERERSGRESSDTERTRKRYTERKQKRRRERERERKSSIDVISSTRLKGDSYIALWIVPRTNHPVVERATASARARTRARARASVSASGAERSL